LGNALNSTPARCAGGKCYLLHIYSCFAQTDERAESVSARTGRYDLTNNMFRLLKNGVPQVPLAVRIVPIEPAAIGQTLRKKLPLIWFPMTANQTHHLACQGLCLGDASKWFPSITVPCPRAMKMSPYVDPASHICTRSQVGSSGAYEQAAINLIGELRGSPPREASCVLTPSESKRSPLLRSVD
jgi:hypothetical protein